MLVFVLIPGQLATLLPFLHFPIHLLFDSRFDTIPWKSKKTTGQQMGSSLKKYIDFLRGCTDFLRNLSFLKHSLDFLKNPVFS